VGRIWWAIRRGAHAALQRSGTAPLAQALAQFESDIFDEGVLGDILAEHARLVAAEPVIVPFRPTLREHFYRINAEWLERWFTIEDIDRRVLSEPETHILKPGGAIVFAAVDGGIIGTCALLHQAPG